MNIIKSFSEKQEGIYKEEVIKNVFSPLGKMMYQPKRATFLIEGSKISINLDEVGGAFPTAEPFRITLHLNKSYESNIEIYPSSFFEKIFQKMLLIKNKNFKNGYIFKGDDKLFKKLSEEKLFTEQLQKQRIYIRIPKENTAKIILTPERGIESEAQLDNFIKILKSIEAVMNVEND